jgi:hypothetical protein
MAFGKKKTLRVEFLESRTQVLVGYDELPLRDIPESFKDDTWVEIDYDRWKVVRVEPDKLRQARREGVLKVHVDLVERRPRPVAEDEVEEVVVAVEEVKEAVIYRNPSRADQLPRLSGKRDDLQLLEIASYAWRDIEFTLEANRSTVRDVFGKIEELIHLNSTQRDGRTFYTRQYDRYDMFAPLRGTRLALETVITDYFPSARAVDGLTFMGSEQVADSTFVFRVNAGIGFYGQEFDDIIRYLAIVRPEKLVADALRADAAQIAAMMKRKELIIVDWQRREVVEALEDAVYDFFLRGFADHAVAVAHGETTTSTVPPVGLEKPAPVAQPPVASVPSAPQVEPTAPPAPELHTPEIAQAPQVEPIAPPAPELHAPEIAQAPQVEPTAPPAPELHSPEIAFAPQVEPTAQPAPELHTPSPVIEFDMPPSEPVLPRPEIVSEAPILEIGVVDPPKAEEENPENAPS